jgi:hypothetical protein
MADKKARKKTGRKKIIIIIVLVLIVLGAAIYYGFASGFLGQLINGTKKDVTISKTGTEYKEVLNKAQDKVYDLIASGDNQSIEEATKIVDDQIAAADKSGNEGYSVDANLAKTTLLVETGRPQQALDEVLIPLEDKYGDNEAYKYSVYAGISWAYRELGDTAKADEYFNKIPGEGWD